MPDSQRQTKNSAFLADSPLVWELYEASMKNAVPLACFCASSWSTCPSVSPIDGSHASSSGSGSGGSTQRLHEPLQSTSDSSPLASPSVQVAHSQINRLPLGADHSMTSGVARQSSARAASSIASNTLCRPDVQVVALFALASQHLQVHPHQVVAGTSRGRQAGLAWMGARPPPAGP